LPKVEADDFDSDADDDIDENYQKARIKKEKNKSANVKYCYDKARNTYLEEDSAKSDPYHQDLYQIRRLESRQHFQLQQFLGNNLDLFIWQKELLGQTNLVKYRIDTGDALPIKQYPYRHSLTEKKTIQNEISYMISARIIRL
ncbi:3869_t:CDS:2, partial [Racocetra persica]